MLIGNSTARYGVVALSLHWLIAATMMFMLLLGNVMVWMPDSSFWTYAVFQLHKSLGITILVLTLARIAWRVAHPPPPLPSDLKPWERHAAHAGHLALYGLMLGLPLSGWLLVSASTLGVETWPWGLFKLPYFSVFEAMGEGERKAAYDGLVTAHWLLGWAAVGLIGVHVGAALKHHLELSPSILERMLPGRMAPGPEIETPAPSRNEVALASAVALVAVAILAAGFSGRNAPTAPVAASQVDTVAARTGVVTRWEVVADRSVLGFRASESGTAFEGSFGTWLAEIAFDPERLDDSRVRVVIDMASARTGADHRDQALPNPEWFAAARFPQAMFETTAIRHLGDNRYEAEALLTIRDKSNPVTLPFTLDIEGDQAVVAGEVALVRTEFDVGTGTWASGDTVSLEVVVGVDLLALKVQ